MNQKKNRLNRGLKIGVVGATGMVGKSFMETLEFHRFPVGELRPFASEASLGKSVLLQNKTWPIQVLNENCFEGLDLVFFSSGDDISAQWAPEAVKCGAWAIDNSAAFRMDPNVFLIVPEVNGDLLDQDSVPKIIANPNCSTIQLVVALKPLADQFGIESVKVSTYQAVSGAGQMGHDELDGYARNYGQNQSKSQMPDGVPSPFPHPIGFNAIPEIGGYKENGYYSEELKIIHETKKILDQPNLKVSAFAVRVPVFNAHAETVWIKLTQIVQRHQVVKALSEFAGIVVEDEPAQSRYPIQSRVSGQDPVFVGRIHQDLDDPQTWLMWVVSDNIRKGAALNGLQIAERIFDIR